jgi:hypothetical protein
MKKTITLLIIGILCLSAFSILSYAEKVAASTGTVSEFDTYPGLLPYSDPNDNLLIGWTLDLSTPGASEGRDVVTQRIGASLNGTVFVSTAGSYLISVWVLDRGTADKIRIDDQEWVFVAPATGTPAHEEFKQVVLGMRFLSAGSHNVTLTHVAAGTVGSYPTNSILDYLELDISATVDIVPNALNLKSRGKWITAYIELPQDYNAADIDVSTIALNSTFSAELTSTAIGDYDSDGIPDLMVKFNRTELVSFMVSHSVDHGNAVLTIAGQLVGGEYFGGSGTIRVSALVGDVDCNGKVEIADIVKASTSYGSEEEDTNWNPNANFAPAWDKIDMFDLVTCVKHYGEKYP